MPRLARFVMVMFMILGGPALAQDAGRYQIVVAPLNLSGELQSSTLLIDTATGRTWLATLDDKGRPRWRGIEFAGGSQAAAELPPEPEPRAAFETEP